MKYIALVLLSLVTILSGCASIVGNPTQNLPILSTPEGATVTITDEKGIEIFKGKTPTNVTLQKSDGTYWGGKSFNVVISKEGHDTVTIPVKTASNGWYIGGNLIFGGLIGWFIVDPMSGNMYTLSTKEINATLSAKTAQLSTDKDVSIVLLENVPQELRSKLVKVQ